MTSIGIRRALRSVAVTIAIAAAISSTGFSQVHFSATLDGAQAGVASAAQGSGSFSLSENFTELRYVITYQGLSGTLSAGGHFHIGRRGTSGSVVKNIASPGDPASATISGTWSSRRLSTPHPGTGGVAPDRQTVHQPSHCSESSGRDSRPGRSSHGSPLRC